MGNTVFGIKTGPVGVILVAGRQPAKSETEVQRSFRPLADTFSLVNRRHFCKR